MTVAVRWLGVERDRFDRELGLMLNQLLEAGVVKPKGVDPLLELVAKELAQGRPQ